EDNRIPGGFWKQKIIAGRQADPGRPDEVDVSFLVAQARNLKPGDSLPVMLETAHGQPVRFVFRVAGIEAAAAEFPPQIDAAPGDVWPPPAFWRTHRSDSRAFPEAVLRLRHGAADVAAVERSLAHLAHGKNAGSFSPAAQAANTEHSIHLQTVALWLLAG